MAVALAGLFTGLGLTGSITIGGTVVTTASIAASITLSVGSLAASYALNRLTARRAPTSPQRKYQESLRQAVPPRRRSYGHVLVSGPIGFAEARGDYVYYLFLMNSGAIETIEEWWIADRKCLIETNGDVTTSPYRLDNAPVIRLEWGMGYSDQAASPTLAAAFAEWTADHRLAGVAWTLMRLKKVPADKFSAVYNNATPSLRQLMDGARIFDPRDSGQSVDNPDTWESRDNPALQLLDFLTSSDGFFLNRAIFAQAAFVAAADVCDGLVALKAGGAERRYRSSGTYELTDSPVDTVETLLASCAGDLYLTDDGLIGLEIDDDSEPDVVITDDDIVAFDISDAPGALQGYRAIRGKFTSPPHGYKEQATGAIHYPGFEPGSVSAQDFDLPWVPSNGQALRLCKKKLYRDNPPWSGQLNLNAGGLRLINRRRFRLQTSVLGGALDGVWRITGELTVAGDLTAVGVSCAIIDSRENAWDEDVDELDPPGVPPNTSEDDTLAPPENVRAQTGKRGADMWVGLAWNPPPGPRSVDYRWRLAGGDWSDPQTAPAGANFVEFGGLTESESYDAEVRFRDATSNVTSWVGTSFDAEDDQSVPAAPTALAASGGVESATASATQSVDDVAFVIEWIGLPASAPAPDFSAVHAARAVVAGAASGSITFSQGAGDRKVWARARTVANQASGAVGPVAIEVADPPPPGSGSDGGSGGEPGGGGGAVPGGGDPPGGPGESNGPGIW